MRPRLPIRRILFLRPFRPPNSTRLFTRNTLPGARPALDFLYPPTRKPHSRRYISTETRVWIKDEMKKGLKYTAYIYAFAGCLFIMAWSVHTEWTERRYQPPKEWRWLTRNQWKMAKQALDEDDGDKPFIDWPLIGQYMRLVISRLEDPKLDGAGLTRQADGEGILVEGVGETGFDISNKSEPWRRGYYEALFNAAKAAEYMEECVLDTKSKIIFPKNTIRGPSNPEPRPLPPGVTIPAPLEENVENIFEAPQHYYMRILTTRGFNEKQYVDAALGYAAYLDFKQTPDTALEMYKWALDIATSGSPEAKSAIDSQTGILKNGKIPSENILNISTALAVHHALTSNLTLALPIFLSVLRAHRSLPEPPITKPTPPPLDEKNTITDRLVSTGKTLLISPDHPPPPSDGTSPPTRTPKQRCEEAGIMANVGEIFYASKSTPSLANKEAGLAWTREAVDIAEEQLARSKLAPDAIRTCKQCLGVSIGNWDTMISNLAHAERATKREDIKNGVKTGGWMGFGGEEKDMAVPGRWESEEEVVRERKKRASGLLETGLQPPKRRSPTSFLTA